MSNPFDVLWINASPSLKHFDLPLMRYLSRQVTIARWEYYQTKDEASSLDKAVTLLHDYLQFCDRPVHLVGHGMSGVIAWSYAQRFPGQVRSLSLLAVAAQPAATWQAHYYVQRKLLTCSREQILANAVRTLFGNQPPFPVKDLVMALDRDLEESPCLHSLFKLVSLPKAGVTMPMMVCGSQTDPIVHPSALHEWADWLKPEDLLWECPEGRHFFHYFYPQQIGDLLWRFWKPLDVSVPEVEMSYLKASA